MEEFFAPFSPAAFSSGVVMSNLVGIFSARLVILPQFLLFVV